MFAQKNKDFKITTYELRMWSLSEIVQLIIYANSNQSSWCYIPLRSTSFEMFLILLYTAQNKYRTMRFFEINFYLQKVWKWISPIVLSCGITQCAKNQEAWRKFDMCKVKTATTGREKSIGRLEKLWHCEQRKHPLPVFTNSPQIAVLLYTIQPKKCPEGLILPSSRNVTLTISAITLGTAW